MFERLIRDNGVNQEEGHTPEYPFECFDIVPYAETCVFEAAKDPDTREANRDLLFKVYEKASGKEEEQEEELPYGERIQMIRKQIMAARPKTKHSKKIMQWKKVKTVQKMKKKLLSIF